MISERMQDALNKQINAEFYSAYLYLSMSAWYETKSLAGFANWTRVQAQEELVHGTMMYDFINERGGVVTLGPVEGPRTTWASAVDVYKDIYAHEQKVTALINNLMKIAREENDNAAVIFLEWFVTEQVEEEKSADEYIQKLTLVGDNGYGVYQVDKEAATRVFVMPGANTGA